MEATTGSSDTELTMLRAAELYYYDGLTHAQIAEQLATSRWTVGRLLERARETGIVRISIEHPQARPHHLEVALREQFGLREAIVVPARPEPAATLEAVCASAAEHLAGLRPHPTTVGLSWGRTTSLVAARLPQGWSRGVTVVQTNGGLSVGPVDHVSESLRVMAQRGPGTVRLLPAPTIVGSVDLGRQLRDDSAIAQTLRAAAAARVLVWSPGSANASSVLVDSGYLRASEVSRLARLGVVGDVVSHFVDVHGAVIDADLDARTISIGLNEVRACPTSIAVASGADKTAITAAAVRAGLCTTLVTDSHMAEALLASPMP